MREEKVERGFLCLQRRMLITTMIGYTLFYFMRKNFSFAMPGLQQDCGISKAMLGNFLFWGGIVYGLSKFVNGIIGDKCRPKVLLLFGLFACTLVNVAFGFVPQLVGREVMTLAWTLGILFVLNQFFQGTGFPPCAKLIAHWIPPKELATKMSIWNTSHSIGGGLVAKACGVLMGLGVIGSANQGIGMWKWCFWSMAILGAVGLLILWVFLPGTPSEEGIAECSGTSLAQATDAATPLDRRSMMRAVFLNPVIWMLGLCNFTINATRALIADWGPTLLQEAKGLSSSEAGSVIMWFEFAGIVGMLVAGWATDRFFGGRAPRLCVFLMALTGVLLAAFWFLPAGGLAGLVGGAALCAAGFCLYGPQALTGVTATNTSTKIFAGTSIGFISLFSYVGVSVSGKVCGTLAHTHGWQMPVLTMTAVALAGCLFFLLLWNVRPNVYEKS